MGLMSDDEYLDFVFSEQLKIVKREFSDFPPGTEFHFRGFYGLSKWVRVDREWIHTVEA